MSKQLDVINDLSGYVDRLLGPVVAAEPTGDWLAAQFGAALHAYADGDDVEFFRDLLHVYGAICRARAVRWEMNAVEFAFVLGLHVGHHCAEKHGPGFAVEYEDES